MPLPCYVVVVTYQKLLQSCICSGLGAHMLLSVTEQSCIVHHGIEVLHQPCREGINFALTRPEDHTPGAPPPYIQFLSVLGEFSNRLLDVDRTGKKGVLVYLQVSL